MKKIVFVVSELKIGGAEKIFHDLVLALHKDALLYNVTVICLYKKGKLGERLSNQGVEIYENVLKNKFDLMGIFKFINILKKKKPHTLYITGQSLTQAVVFAGSLFVKIPVSIIRFPTHDLATKPYYRLLINKVSIYFAKKIICGSESHKKHVIGKIPDADKKIEIIYNGVDINKFSPYKTCGYKDKFFIPKGSMVIGIVACLRKEKAVDILIKAMPQIIKHYPNAFLAIVGGGKEHDYLRNIVKDLEISSNVSFLGEREDVADIIPLFDIACLSSISGVENFSNSILEYMSCGKPVVATRIGGIPEMVKHGFNGFLVNSNSSHELAAAIISLLNNEELRVSMGKNSRDIIEQKFSLDRMIDNYKRILEKEAA